MEMGRAQLMQNEKPQRQLIFPNRENVVGQQLQNVLGVIAMTSNALNIASVQHSDTQSNGFPGEAKTALEVTLIKACDRMDQILADDRRWDLALQEKLEQDFEDLRVRNVRALDTAARADEQRIQIAKELQTPHAKYRPTLSKTVDGKWAAFINNPAEPGTVLAGTGNTPVEALRDFDQMFINGITSDIEKTNAKTVDMQRNDETPKTSLGGSQPVGDSLGIQPDEGFSGRSDSSNGGALRRWLRRLFFR